MEEDLEFDTEESEPTPKPPKKPARASKNNARHSVESKGKEVVDNSKDVNLPDSADEQVLPVDKCKYSGNISSTIQ
jgi:hypothetical protein